jgi:Glycosyltransferase family 87
VRRLVIPAAVVGAYLAFVFAIGTPAGWKDVGVPGKSLSFFDLRSITTGWVCTRRGIDVLPRNPCDPELRPANYPRIWLWPSHLGLGVGATVPLGIAIAVAFLATAILLAPRDGHWWRTLAYSAFLVTPGVMLGVERGNVDLLLFCLVALAVWLFARPARRWVSAGVVLVASILKLFPIFALPFLLRQPRRQAAIAITVVVIGFGAYVLATLDDIRTIVHAVPKSGRYSYGLDILGHPLSRHVPGDRYLWDAVLAVVALVAATLIARRMRSPSAPRFELDAFVAGFSVFALTYVFFRNFDYRLAFLLLTLPLLLRRAGERRIEAWATLAAMLGALCLESRRALPEGVVSQYALFVLLLAQALVVSRITSRPSNIHGSAPSGL